jgi:hypothetical protein
MYSSPQSVIVFPISQTVVSVMISPGMSGHTTPVRIRRSFCSAKTHFQPGLSLLPAAIVDGDEPRVTGSAQNAQKCSCTQFPGHPAVPYTISPLSLIARSGNFLPIHASPSFHKKRGTDGARNTGARMGAFAYLRPLKRNANSCNSLGL